MIIKKAEIFKIKLPLISPFRTGFGEIKDRTLVWLKLVDKNGLIGYGESANLEEPIYEPEFNDSMILVLGQIIPRLINKQINSIEELTQSINYIKGNNFAKAALDAAFWHLESQDKNLPLWKLWGGVKTKIPAAISIGLEKSLLESINKILKYIDRFQPRRIKLKIKPGIDIDLIQAIRKSYPKLSIQVDANASYTLKDIKIFQSLDHFNLLMIEQPLGFDDILDHALLAKKIKTPLCLDESIRSLQDVKLAIQLKACKIINIKPQRVGGYYQAKVISQFCEKNKIQVWCGGMIESGWGQYFNSSISSLSNFKLDNDICLTKWYLADDILEEPIQEKNGIIDLENLNVKISNKKLKKYSIEKIIVE